jgi:hypothetical protein
MSGGEGSNKWGRHKVSFTSKSPKHPIDFPQNKTKQLRDLKKKKKKDKNEERN